MLSKAARTLAKLLLALSMALLPSPGLSDPLPGDGRIAVVLRGAGALSVSDVAGAVASVVRELVVRGYRVVDKDRLDAMERTEAARLALEGNVEAIIALGKKFGVGYYVKGTAEGHRPSLNEFGLYTATVTISMVAYRASDGAYLFADGIVGKEVGYTPQEATSKALLSAAGKMAGSLAEGENRSGSEVAGGKVRVFSLSVSGLQGLVGAEAFQRDLETLKGVESASLKSGKGSALLEVSFRGSPDELAERIREAFEGVSIEPKTPSSMVLSFKK